MMEYSKKKLDACCDLWNKRICKSNCICNTFIDYTNCKYVEKKVERDAREKRLSIAKAAFQMGIRT